jgi:O-acetyl-ADP-ribose deacetylase (regulator of RNase III)
MQVILADHNKQIYELIKRYDPTFLFELGNPLAFEIDGVVSPANTTGIMNGGFDAALRKYFGNTLEYRVRMSLKEKPIQVGEARAIQTVHEKINWLIVVPTVSVAGNGLSGHSTVAYTCAYNAIISAHNHGVKTLGMTGLGTGAGRLNAWESVREQCDGIEDALSDTRE